MPVASLAERVGRVPLWYHTLELPHGVTTPGWFDHRPVVERMPWPDVKGARCLDIGTYDGFFAFELERRGASEVVALDIAEHADWEWAPRQRDDGPRVLAAMAGAKGEGFLVAKEALQSRVERVLGSVYDLSPAHLGTFDVVVCGSLLLHLQDPVGALGAIRGICRGTLLSAEAIDPNLTSLGSRRALARFDGTDGRWWIPSRIGHERMLVSAGFTIEKTVEPYVIPPGSGYPAAGASARPFAEDSARLHAAVLCAPVR